jgi:O-antigen ligase
MAVCLILTFSRGAFAGVAAAMLGLALVRYRRLLPLFLIALVLLLLLPATQDYVVHFTQGLQGQDLATQMRFGEYHDALILIGRYPIFGVGFASAPDIDLYLGVSNVYLLIAEEMGLIGLAAFLILVSVLFALAWRARRAALADARLEPLWLGLHAALAGALVGGLFDHYFFNLDFHHAITLFWLVFGLAAAATRLAYGTRSPMPPQMAGPRE